MLQENEPTMLIPYWLVLSPLPYFLMICNNDEPFDIPSKLAPYRVQTIVDIVTAFLSPVEKDQRVIMAFNNPNGVYENVFDGYRTIVEVPLYVGCLRKLHFFPDWWAVFDTNYEGAPEFWGRTLPEVDKNVELWNCDFVVVYQGTGTKLDEKWENAGYVIVGEMDWGDYNDTLKGVRVWSGETPKWWLLKVPERVKVADSVLSVDGLDV
jgi:hypothetical protein